MTKHTFLLVIAFLTTTAATAQTARVLVPVRPGNVPGAHGAEWRTEVVIANVSDTPLQVSGFLSSSHCAPLCAGVPPIPPHQSVIVAETLACETPGFYLSVESSRLPDLAVSLRSRDLSRRLETLGTAIPVATPADLYGRTFGINDIPLEEGFRSALRIFNTGVSGSVAVRFYAINNARIWPDQPTSGPDRLLLELRPAFVVPQSGGGTMSCPSFVEIALDTLPALAGAGRIRAEIQPLDSQNTYWAYVSATHNNTQHVTVLTPH